MSTFKSGSARIIVEKLSWTPHLHVAIKVGREERWSGIINNADTTFMASHGWSRYPAAARLGLEAARIARTIQQSEIEVDDWRQPIVSPTSKRKSR